jgi:hypothetical protein
MLCFCLDDGLAVRLAWRLGLAYCYALMIKPLGCYALAVSGDAIIRLIPNPSLRPGGVGHAQVSDVMFSPRLASGP